MCSLNGFCTFLTNLVVSKTTLIGIFQIKPTPAYMLQFWLGIPISVTLKYATKFEPSYSCCYSFSRYICKRNEATYGENLMKQSKSLSMIIKLLKEINKKVMVWSSAAP